MPDPALIAAGAAIGAGAARWAYRTATSWIPDPQLDDDQPTARWAGDIARRFGPAWAQTGLRPNQWPAITGRPSILPTGGIEWPIKAAADLVELRKHEQHVGATVNRGDVALVRIVPTPGSPGIGRLRVFPVHPLAVARPWTGEPGTSTIERWDQPARVGVTEAGAVAAVGTWQTHSLWGGMTGSGKSKSVVRWLADLFPHDWADITVYDLSVKKGEDYESALPRLRGLVTDRGQVIEDLHRQYARIAARKQTGRRFAPGAAEPQVVLVIDEAPALFAGDSDEATEVLLRIIRETRALGASLVMLSQSAYAAVFDTMLRAEFTRRVCHRMGNKAGAEAVLGELTGVVEGPWEPYVSAGWPGAFYRWSDDEGLSAGRADFADDDWLAAHALVCEGVGERVRSRSDSPPLP